jgi:hypothetical protein
MRKLLFNYSFYSHPEIGKFQGVTPRLRRSSAAAVARRAPSSLAVSAREGHQRVRQALVVVPVQTPHRLVHPSAIFAGAPPLAVASPPRPAPLPPLAFVQGRRILNQQPRLDWTRGQKLSLTGQPSV